MYLLDPDKGRRRRALIRDKAARLWRESRTICQKTSRDMNNRVRGMASIVNSLFSGGEADYAVVEARVRSRLGRLCSHPGSIYVEVRPGGEVILSGPVPQDEIRQVVSGIEAVPGVAGVENRLEPHADPGNVPGLQGGSSRRGQQSRFELMQTNWSPAARALVGAAGSTLTVWGIARRGVSGAALGFLGAAALARSISNREMKSLVGVGSGRRSVDIRKTIEINCPVERVFEFWANYENFPKFMSNLKEVRDVGAGRSHWVAVGPAGIPVEWDARITSLKPNEQLSWRSDPGSRVDNSGNIRFEANPDGTTRLDIRISYRPPAGAVGHVVARIFGADPERAMSEDLARLKSLLEVGRTRAKGELVTRDKLEGVARSLVPGENG